MQCPKCYGDMERVSEDPVFVDRCHQCHGMYFDQLDQQLLDQMDNDASIDSGDESVGAEYNEMVYVECPKCDKIMDQRLLDDPIHIRFELCPSCHSTFLDAGELREYLSETHRAHFRELLPSS